MRLLNGFGESPLRDDVPYPLLPYPGGGGAKIFYTINSVSTASSGHYTGLKVANVTIFFSPCSREGLLGTTADVVDHLGCLFNEDNSELVGRKGTAVEGVAISLDTGLPPNTVTPCHWGADGICCP